MQMPESDPDVVARRAEIATAMRRIVSHENVIDKAVELRVYESDALTAYRQMPLLVVLPQTTQQVSDVLAWANENRIKVVPRGAGTSLSGGALPLGDGILLSLGKFNRILEIDPANRIAVVQPGVTNAAISEAVAGHKLFYAPDPSSQIACTIGGNVAENAGGVHCLKYGLTSHNVVGVEVVLMDGQVVRLGDRTLDNNGYDLLGLITGSEGLLGVVTEVTVRLLPMPESTRALLLGFETVEDAAQCVAGIMAAGIVPAGLEMMDRPAIHAAEAFVSCGYPLEVEAMLIVEVDGPPAECDYLVELITVIAEEHKASSIRHSRDESDRQAIWAGRKAAFPAVGRISPDYYCMDGTIPRRRLPDILHRMSEMASQARLRIVNVFHAGDGNLHPMILYDAEVADEFVRAEALGADILKLCVEMGGVLSGEHGVGVEKRDLMPFMFSDIDMDHQIRVKTALDPHHLLNPGKVFPTLHRCAEHGRLHIHKGQVRFPELPRF